MSKAKAEEPKAETILIKAPKFRRAVFILKGTAPYVQQKFSAEAAAQMREGMLQGSQKKKGAKREARDFQKEYLGCMHKGSGGDGADGWYGIPATSIRGAMISACRVVGFKMTLAKLSVFVEQDGFDIEDGSPLIRMTDGEPKYVEHHVRNMNGKVDLRARPMWMPGWQADATIRWDADQFSMADVTNLLSRAGMQVGIGAGRPDSTQSAGMGWGLFKIAEIRPVQDEAA